MLERAGTCLVGLLYYKIIYRATNLHNKVVCLTTNPFRVFYYVLLSYEFDVNLIGILGFLRELQIKIFTTCICNLHAHPLLEF